MGTKEINEVILEKRRKAREYNQRPDVKERRRKNQREYNQRPEVKERRREYNQRPEVKERNRKYMGRDGKLKKKQKMKMKEKIYIDSFNYTPSDWLINILKKEQGD
tara:strand:- start:7184 stop:7501 length:318 start_codon:yes stop_codon:yes gene_type:complete